MDTLELGVTPTSVAEQQGVVTFEEGLVVRHYGHLDAVPQARYSFHRDLVVSDHVITMIFHRRDRGSQTGGFFDHADTFTNHQRGGLVSVTVVDEGFQIVDDAFSFFHGCQKSI
ncbi:hypothetical protein D3C86_1738040 [compost metagenome]